MRALVEVNTADLIGPALDWAVAHATKAWEWAHDWFPTMTLDPTFRGVSDSASDGHVNLVPNNPMRQGSEAFKPSTDWAQGGPLIASHAIGFRGYDADNWQAFSSPEDTTYVGIGPTHLIAACRMIAAAKFGKTIKVPAELLK